VAWVLFALGPDTHGGAGFDATLTPQLAVAIINIHHFVVDAYIWRLRRDPNDRTVVEAPGPAMVRTRPGRRA
jgi:hypothetical protein